MSAILCITILVPIVIRIISGRTAAVAAIGCERNSQVSWGSVTACAGVSPFTVNHIV